MPAFSNRVMHVDDWRLIAPYFKPSEFDHPARMGFQFMLWLRDVRVAAGVPMVVTSDWRQRLIGGAQDSAHDDEICDCVDIGFRPRPNDPHWNYSRAQIFGSAWEAGCRRFGMYTSGGMHLDRTEHRRPSPRIWIMVDNPITR